MSVRPGLPPLAEYALRLGDTCLVLGHRVSEWCGHAPNIELDLALANIGLDLIGQGASYLAYAGEVEGKGRDGDRLAYHRDGVDYRNLLLVEHPNEDFAVTVVRQFLFDAYHAELTQALAASRDARLAGIAAKAQKEARYHLRFSGEWVVRLGDGTAESARRAQEALDRLWPFTGEMFQSDALHDGLTKAGIAPALAPIRAAWSRRIDDVLSEAALVRPKDGWMQSGGILGNHTEALGHMLATMQYLPRAHPGAAW